MKKLKFKMLIPILLFSVFSIDSALGQSLGRRLVPTHADAAVVFAKHSGLFDRYVASDANLNDCVSFLNKHGIFFSLLEVVGGSEFTMDDCSRVMGQIELIFTGEASFLAGKVLLPKGIDSWRNFCILEGVDYEQGYKGVLEALNHAQDLKH